MRLFLDANVLFTAAHNPRGKAALVMELEGRRSWKLFSSQFAFEEARRNLEQKFPEHLERLDTIQRCIQFVEHQPKHAFPDGLASKDQPIFLAAVACRATHLLTGDLKDFGRFMNRPDETSGIRVQTVAQFLDHVR